MRITRSQLKKIIQEERVRLQRAGLIEGFPGAPGTFYEDKLALIDTAINKLDEVINIMQQVAELDMSSPVGEDSDIQSATMDLQAAREFMAGISDAVGIMADSAGVA